MLRGCRTDNHKHLLLYFETMLFVGEPRGEAPSNLHLNTALGVGFNALFTAFKTTNETGLKVHDIHNIEHSLF